MSNISLEAIRKSKVFHYFEKYMMAMGVIGQLLYYVQGVKIFINKSATDVSLLGFMLGLISVSSWLIYGLLIKNKVLVIANIFAVLGALLVILGILIHG